MQIEIPLETKIDAPAAQVWRIVAHQFDRIGEWATAIPDSAVNQRAAVPAGAEVGGRVCATSVPGFAEIEETFTYYDESGRRFGYEASAGLPRFMRRAQNNWAVVALGPNQSLVKTRGVVEVGGWLGLFLLPFFKWQIGRAGAQTLAELKYFIETGEPHPRKRAQQRGPTAQTQTR